MRLFRPIPFLCAIAILPAFVRAQEPFARLSLEVTPEIVSGKHIYQIEGHTDLPEGTVLDLAIVYLKRLPPIPNLPPEESKMYELEEVPVEAGKVRVMQGRFDQALGSLPRAPYAGDYRLHVSLTESGQPEELTVFLSAHPAPEEGWVVEFTLGTTADLEARKMAVQKEVHADLLAIHSAYRKLTGRFATAWSAAKPDLAAWDVWANGWEESLTPVERSNAQRMESEIYWVEAGGKRYVKYLLRELRILQKDFRAVLGQAPSSRPPYSEFEEEAGSFDALLNRYLQNLGFGAMMDEAGVRTALETLADVLETARGRLESGASPDPEASAALQSRATEALFILVREVNEYGYAGVMEIGRTLPEALSAVAASSGTEAAARSRAREALDRASEALARLRALLPPVAAPR